jgi:hypothetical protein
MEAKINDKKQSIFTSILNEKLRNLDFKINRTADGFLDNFGITRHSWHYLLLPILVAGIVVMGVPELTVRLGFAILAMLLVAFFLIYVIPKFSKSVLSDLIMQVIVVFLIIAIVLILGKDSYEKKIFLYNHFFVLATIVVGLTIILVGIFSSLSWWKFKSENSNYYETIRKTELFISPVEEQSRSGWIRSIFTVPIEAPILLLLPPAVISLTSPPDTGWWFEFKVIGLFVTIWILLSMTGLNSRLKQLWFELHNFFFRGLTPLISLVVIVLGVCRFLGVSYVTTIFDSAEGRIISMMLFFTYVISFWYDYWVNRMLGQELIQFLCSTKQRVLNAKIPYDIDDKFLKTNVPKNDRVLQIHGSSRFIVIQGFEEPGQQKFFQTYSFDKLFEHLAITVAPDGLIQKDKELRPGLGQILERILDHRGLARLGLIISVFIAFLFINKGVQLPQLVAQDNDLPTLQLSQLLFKDDRFEKRPALIIAASGGGTRAALYTAAVMEGFFKRKKLEDVIMGSGVSGGGAALAYFAGMRPTLIEENGDKAWEQYFKKMKYHYIRDVLNSAIDWKTVFGSRLGILLSESFKNQWNLSNEKINLGEVKDFGLILNTAIAGHYQSNTLLKQQTFFSYLESYFRRFLCGSLSMQNGISDLARKECLFRENTTSELAGGRLIFTNLSQSFFPQTTGETGGPKGLPVVVNDPTIFLETAAALNANFPPVFSNAAVDLGSKIRYWVTDGGAVDNRGVEMLLYALQKTLLIKDKCKSLPKINVVIADASSYSDDYAQDRGIGTTMGAGKQTTSLLSEELIKSIKTVYKEQQQEDDFKVIYLPMPICLRESGSFGTHWMLQPAIEIKIGPKDTRTLNGPKDMVRLLRAMHEIKTKKCQAREGLSEDAKYVYDYALRDTGWRNGAKELGFIH